VPLPRHVRHHPHPRAQRHLGDHAVRRVGLLGGYGVHAHADALALGAPLEGLGGVAAARLGLAVATQELVAGEAGGLEEGCVGEGAGRTQGQGAAAGGGAAGVEGVRGSCCCCRLKSKGCSRVGAEGCSAAAVAGCCCLAKCAEPPGEAAAGASAAE